MSYIRVLTSIFNHAAASRGTMKFSLNLACLSLATAAAISSPEAISYDGYTVHRVKAGRNAASVKARLAAIPHETLNQVRGEWDVLIAPEHADAFDALKLKSRVVHADLGNSIKRESTVKRHWKRQSNGSDDAWFDSYHPYDDVSSSALKSE
jgi:hypothetical protein